MPADTTGKAVQVPDLMLEADRNCRSGYVRPYGRLVVSLGPGRIGKILEEVPSLSPAYRTLAACYGEALQ